MLIARDAHDDSTAVHTSYGDVHVGTDGSNMLLIGDGSEKLRAAIDDYAQDGFSTDEVKQLAGNLGLDSGATDALLGAFDVRDSFQVQDDDEVRSAIHDFDRGQGHARYQPHFENGAMMSSTDIASDADVDRVAEQVKKVIGNDPAKVRERIRQVAHEDFQSSGNWSIGSVGLDAVPEDKLTEMRDQLEQRLLRACGLD
jgi:hypothetical protein